MFNFPIIKEYGLNCVYRITIGDYFYFGSTTCIRSRIDSHKQGRYALKLKKAIEKYNHCSLEIIKFTETENECRYLELKYILENNNDLCLNTVKKKTTSKNRDGKYSKATISLTPECYEKLLVLAEKKKWSVNKTVEYVLLKQLPTTVAGIAYEKSNS
jgi:hypothetical protein